jgi:hypothetical protein
MKNELINIKKESYEDYDFSDEQLEQIEQIMPSDKIKKTIILSCVILIGLIFTFLGLIFLMNKIKLKNLKNEFEVIISSEDLGTIIESTEEVESFISNNISGNLAQYRDFSQASSSGLITNDENNIYYVSDECLYKMNISTGSVELLYEEKQLKLRNLCYSNNCVFSIFDSNNYLGLNKSFLCFYKINSGNFFHYNNLTNSNLQALTQTIPSFVSNNKGIYFTLLNSENIYYYDFLLNSSSTVCNVKTSLSTYAKILNISKDTIWFLDNNGVSSYNISNENMTIISKIPQNVSYQPFIHNNELIFRDNNSIYINNKKIYEHNNDIETINAYENKILFISNNVLYSLNINTLEISKIHESSYYINEIYVVNDYVILDSNNINLIKLK